MLKIIYYFLNKDTMMYQWQKYHIFDELSMHNCKVEILSPLDYPSVSIANEMLIKKCKSNNYDMFFTTFNEEYLFHSTVEEIKKIGIPTVLFCPDNLVAPFNHQTIAPLFDLVWLTSKETQYLFNEWGCKSIFQPYAANPNFLKPNYPLNEISKVGFIGTPHGSRISRINSLLEAGIPVSMHSSTSSMNNNFSASFSQYAKVYYNYSRYSIGRKLAIAAIKDKLIHRHINDTSEYLEIKEPVPLSMLAEANCAYSLVLSFTDASSTGVLKNPVPIVNLRNFEIPMSGGLQFTTYTEELAEYFEDGKEIILCKSKEEYIEKARYYLQPERAEERLKMKEAARFRAENEHNWYKRFSIIFNILGIKGEVK